MAQYVYRRPPYPYYNMEGIESWLEDLITDGLWLDKDGFIFGMMQFRPGTPRKLKYRLEPIEKQSFLYLGQPNPPSEKALTLYEEFGWEYLGTFYDFYIYRSMDEYAVELNTDPTLQAQALRHVRRRSGLLLVSILAILFVGLWFLLREANFLLQIINRGWQRTALLFVYLTVIPVYYLISWLHTVRLQKKLERGESLARNKDWRKGRCLRQLLISLPFLMYVVAQLATINSVNAIYDNALDPESHQDPLPFVTMQQMDEERTLERNGEPQLSIWSSPISSTNIYWTEYGYMNHQEEERWNGGITLFYHKAANEWLSKQLYQEYIHEQETYLDQLNSPWISRDPESLDPAQYGFDELTVYADMSSPVIFLRDGNTVIKAVVHVYTWGTDAWQYEVWLEKMAALYA